MSVSRLWLWVIVAGFAVFYWGTSDTQHSSNNNSAVATFQNVTLGGFLNPISTALSKPSTSPGSKTSIDYRKIASKGKSTKINNNTWEITDDTSPQPIDAVPPPKEMRGDLSRWVKYQRVLGDNVWQAGVAYQTRLKELRELCDSPNAPPAQCDMYRLSQQIFAFNYKTSLSNYRGYITFHKKRKRWIPKRWMRRYYRLSKKRFKKTSDECYINQGLLSNCMTFAMCAQKKAMWNFKGSWGKGFGYPYWGNIQYLTSQAYYRHLEDYEKNGKMRAGINTLMKQFNDLDLNDKRMHSRRLLLDIYDTYMTMVKRKRRSKVTRDKYRKAFCSTIVVNARSFKRALPGDVFGMMYVYKRLHQNDDENRYRYHFQHWGLIIKPEIKYVLHNQTPGGLWGRQFKRWGIQFGRLGKLEGEWTWHKKSGRYRKKVFVVHRLNLHYFVQARLHKTKVYNANKPQLCRRWIRRHADLYFTDMSASLPSANNIPQSSDDY